MQHQALNIYENLLSRVMSRQTDFLFIRLVTVKQNQSQETVFLNYSVYFT